MIFAAILSVVMSGTAPPDQSAELYHNGLIFASDAPTWVRPDLDDCQFCQGGIIAWEIRHWFGEGNNEHSCLFNPCHPEPLQGRCATFHPLCEPKPGEDGEQEDLQVMLRHLQTALGEDLILGVENRRNVQLNTARAAIQITGCNGALMAHMPLSEGQRRSLVALAETENAAGQGRTVDSAASGL